MTTRNITVPAGTTSVTITVGEALPAKPLSIGPMPNYPDSAGSSRYPLMVVKYTTKDTGVTKTYGVSWNGKGKYGGHTLGLKRLRRDGNMFAGRPFFVSAAKCSRVS